MVGTWTMTMAIRFATMAMTKIATILATLLSATLILGGCQTTPDDDNIQTTPPKVVCTPAELLLTNEAATTEVTIEAEKDWGISSSVDWCKVSPAEVLRELQK